MSKDIIADVAKMLDTAVTKLQCLVRYEVPMRAADTETLETILSSVYILKQDIKGLAKTAKLIPDPNHPSYADCASHGNCYQCSIRDCPYGDPRHYTHFKPCPVCNINDLPPLDI